MLKEQDRHFQLSTTEREKEQNKRVTQFYNHYQAARNHLFDELGLKNPGCNLELLLDKAQQILDRITLILFCEDRGLFPGHRVYSLITGAQCTPAGSEDQIWEELKGIFRAVARGRGEYSLPFKSEGFFNCDSQGDEVRIGNGVFQSMQGIVACDFRTLDPDILGYIFEESIADLEVMKAEIRGSNYRVQGSRKKREGIYYTSSYITGYIVEKTLGNYLGRLKEELGFNQLLEPEKESTSSSVDRQYEERLRAIKILDPACGSGAFLSQAYDYLLQEYQLLEKRWGSFCWSRGDILGHLYGVDLDARAVEVTRFILWLKAAGCQQSLPPLDEHIKAGNSLIDSPELAGEKAFKWKEEFPAVMERGGFELVMGNPPYLSFGLRNTGKVGKREDRYLRKRYSVAQYKLSIYALFIELGISLLRDSGQLGYILPDSFLLGRYYSRLRKFILDHSALHELTIFENDFWSGGNVGKPVIITLQRNKEGVKGFPHFFQSKSFRDLKAFKEGDCRQLELSQDELLSLPHYRFRLFFSPRARRLVEKIEDSSEYLGSKAAKIRTGIRSRIGQRAICSREREGPLWKPGLIKGAQVERYDIDYQGHFLNLDPELLYSGGYQAEVINSPKLFLRQTGDSLVAAYDDSGLYHLNNLHSISPISEYYDPRYLLALINSRLLTCYYRLITLESGRSLAQTDIETLERLPIKDLAPDEQQPLIERVERIMACRQRLREKPLSLDLAPFYEQGEGVRLGDICQREGGYRRLYAGQARRFRGLTVEGDASLTISAYKSEGGKYRLMEMEVEDPFKAQYLKHYLESLNQERIAEIDGLSGNLLDKVLEIEVPAYDRREVVQRAVDCQRRHQQEMDRLEYSLSRTEGELDCLVYRLYGLSEKEIQMVEECYKQRD